MTAKFALTIGGLDPSGGAGITADAVTFAALGVHGAAVATALTYQNTKGVEGFWSASPRELAAQLDALARDVAPAAVKIGMLASEALARALTPYLGRWREAAVPVVFDPVFRSGGGQPLFEGTPDRTTLTSLLSGVTLVTPNTLELAYLLGEEAAANLGAVRTQVRMYHSRYNTPALVTGGHVATPGEVVDVFFTGAEMREYRRPRQERPLHGTGCLVAAAVTAYLAAGADLSAAVERAEEYVTAAVGGAFAAGEGALLPDRTAATFHDAERWRVYSNVVRAVKVFETAANSYKLVPEVGTNIAYALPDARTTQEVCAVPGRLVCVEGAVRAVGVPAFGASGHNGRALLAAMRADPGVRATMNVRAGDDVLAACRELGYRLASFDRAEEREGDAAAEGKTLEWGVERAVAAAGGVPDVIHDRGAVGKEPMVRLFGTDAFDVVRRAVAISRRL